MGEYRISSVVKTKSTAGSLSKNMAVGTAVVLTSASLKTIGLEPPPRSVRCYHLVVLEI